MWQNEVTLIQPAPNSFMHPAALIYLLFSDVEQDSVILLPIKDVAIVLATDGVNKRIILRMSQEIRKLCILMSRIWQ